LQGHLSVQSNLEAAESSPNSRRADGTVKDTASVLIQLFFEHFGPQKGASKDIDDYYAQLWNYATTNQASKILAADSGKEKIVYIIWFKGLGKVSIVVCIN
jgi:hypothetical protein